MEKRRRVYIGEYFEGKPYWPVLFPNLGFQKIGEKRLFWDAVSRYLQDHIIEDVSDIADADFIILPHLVNIYTKQQIHYWVDQGREYDIPVVSYHLGDFTGDFDVPEDTVVFRTSRYKEDVKPNEIIAPPFYEDLNPEGSIVVRQKHSDKKPVVGFCGWGDFSNPLQKAKTRAKDLLSQTYALARGRRYWRACRNGVLLRKKVLARLSESNHVDTNFIIRRSFSRHMNTIELPPEKARKEYIENMRNSDFCLAVRGDGNFSVRFFEILSAGRIPILIDTDTPLPLEEIIDYDKFIIRISHEDIDKIDMIVDRHWREMDSEEFERKQKQARQVFETYLRNDIFYRYAFTHLEELTVVTRPKTSISSM